jgi:uncharacterized protein (TIGR00255 family)
MKSMTGFGTGEAELGPGKLLLDARSVNHRYLDLRVRLPQEFADQALYVEQRARERLARGRFDLAVRYEGPLLLPKLDLDRARSVYRDFARLRDELAPGSELPVTALFAMPGLFTAPQTFDPGAVQAALAQAFDGAIRSLNEMRRREGAALGTEIAARLATCRAKVAHIRERLPEVVRAYEARVRARVAHLLADVGASLAPGRIEAEVVLLADKSDVTEELVRLESHFAQLETLLAGTEPSGRRLDFLLQEMAREANTIGAKCQEAELGHEVIELKSEIERMREQVQNVE